MKQLLLAIGLLTALLPAQERPRSPRREGPPQELQQRLEQMQHRLEELQERLQERRGEAREQVPQRRQAAPQGGERGQMGRGVPPRGRQVAPGERGMRGIDPRGTNPRGMAPRTGIQGHGRGEMLRLRLQQLHRQHFGQPPHPLLHRLQQLREQGPRAGRRAMPESPRNEARGNRKHRQSDAPRQQGKHKRGRDEATEA